MFPATQTTMLYPGVLAIFLLALPLAYSLPFDRYRRITVDLADSYEPYDRPDTINPYLPPVNYEDSLSSEEQQQRWALLEDLHAILSSREIPEVDEIDRIMNAYFQRDQRTGDEEEGEYMNILRRRFSKQ